ncbi:16S rRNA (uracil(1498)-N(3))-methyltransferase [Salisediminibacterium selenitireducens]|uniref:Ribosomal RNA small subunit methyltransferase E n=1 Tax=Bacillus selenitireducens (strain ATCC 700615 / DSM 15326 / MLS10) TaxID=439292 RepID=D6XWB3_BACIE|nr:16S rRNA (uracil(1498)-N(3))-methyltransferase [Salisediminibacterium selenitireducens]ADH99867.1 protein of unknown function DUF558 [[Bacillus] selenitireducens MLS10]
MQRYFVEADQMKEDLFILTGDDAHHISKVMRMTDGDRIICCMPDGSCGTATIQSTAEGRVHAELETWLKETSEMPVEVTLAQGLPKGDKLELIIQKATELGVSSVIPVQMSRSIAKIDEKKAGKKVVRWRKIAKEAAEQAHRNRVPCISEPVSFTRVQGLVEEYDLVIAAYEEEGKAGNHHALPVLLNGLLPGQRILVIIGPEGGFSPEEIEKLERAGVRSVSIGPRILRTETAPLYVLAAVSYQIELSR